jgi:hypothetical protein
MLLLHNCLFGLNVFTELGTKLLFSFQLNLILKGLSRLNPHCPKQASPITPDILLEFYKKLDVTEVSKLYCS